MSYRTRRQMERARTPTEAVIQGIIVFILRLTGYPLYAAMLFVGFAYGPDRVEEYAWRLAYLFFLPTNLYFHVVFGQPIYDYLIWWR